MAYPLIWPRPLSSADKARVVVGSLERANWPLQGHGTPPATRRLGGPAGLAVRPCLTGAESPVRISCGTPIPLRKEPAPVLRSPKIGTKPLCWMCIPVLPFAQLRRYQSDPMDNECVTNSITGLCGACAHHQPFCALQRKTFGVARKDTGECLSHDTHGPRGADPRSPERAVRS